jgi:superoxide reductase
LANLAKIASAIEKNEDLLQAALNTQFGALDAGSGFPLLTAVVIVLQSAARNPGPTPALFTIQKAIQSRGGWIMPTLNELYQSADWKAEKHVPVIEAPEQVAKGEFFKVTATIGKAIAHPNKTEHHIAWITLYFQPEGEKYPVEIARCDFSAHGASLQGPDTSTVYTQHEATVSFKTDKPGTILAASLCNIHGLWQSSKPLVVK